MADISIYGRLTRDPELKDVGGTRLAKLAIADGDRFRAREGEEAQPQYFDCDVWGPQVAVAEYLRKGHRVVVAGQLCPNNYTDKEGRLVRASSVRVSKLTLVETKGESEQQASRSSSGGGYGSAPASAGFSDEIPF